MKSIFFCVVLFLLGLNVQAQTTDFLTGLNDPQDMLLDGNILYVAESDSNRIIKVDLSESNPSPEVVVSGLPVLRGLALNGTELYFSQLNGQNKISKIDLLDPGASPTLVLENFTSAQDLLFYENELYIAQFGTGRIVKIDPSIANPTIIDVVTNINTPIAMEVAGDQLYVATWTDNSIKRIDLTNPSPSATTILSNLSLPVGLNFRGEELFIAEAGQSIGQDRISKINLADVSPTRETVVNGLYNPTKGLETYNNVLYIAENFKISSFELPSLSVDEFSQVDIAVFPNPTSDFITITGIVNPVRYSIYSLSGVLSLDGVITNRDTINLKNMASGTYFLVLNEKKSIKILKI